MSHDEIDQSISNHYGWSGLMETIEQEIRQHGIDPQRVTVDQLAPLDNYQVNTLLPGWYETDLTRGLLGTPRGEQIRCKTPAGQWGTPKDLVGAAIFFTSAASDFITGTQLPVDGGYAIAERMLGE